MIALTVQLLLSDVFTAIKNEIKSMGSLPAPFSWANCELGKKFYEKSDFSQSDAFRYSDSLKSRNCLNSIDTENIPLFRLFSMDGRVRGFLQFKKAEKGIRVTMEANKPI